MILNKCFQDQMKVIISKGVEFSMLSEKPREDRNKPCQSDLALNFNKRWENVRL
jgi:hypothetical protein